MIVSTLTEAKGENGVRPNEFAELFGFRWNAELDTRSIKTHLSLHHLPCQSPEMVRIEFWVTMVAYNAIRTTAFSSAWIAGTKPREVRLVSCCQFGLAAWDAIDFKRGVEHRSHCVRNGQ